MGRPFAQELSAIKETYYAALQCNTDKISYFIKNSLYTPILAVGSGGSYSVACAFALIIQQLGGFAKAITPYDLYMERNNLRYSSIVFFSAGGSNSDVINAYKYVIQHEPRDVFVLCMKKGSRLIDLVKRNNDQNYLEFSIPNGKDGYLAVNSSIAMMTIFTKVYCEITGKHRENLIIKSSIDMVAQEQTLLRKTIIALGGNWTMPVVYDFESKCTEAGLANIQFANLRNFAHGRHHWIAKHMDDTSLVCFISAEERKLALKTLDIIPDSIPKIIIETNHSAIFSTIDLMLQMYYLVNMIGQLKEIDPGRPGVPEFGRKLYHVGYNCGSLDKELKKAKRSKKDRGVMRKISYLTCNAHDLHENIYSNAYDIYINELKQTVFKSIVLDYDNTIIKDNDTNSIIYQKIILVLLEIAKNGIYVAFATGRGKSIREQLQTLIPEDWWGYFWIAYYNGACIGTLADNNQPNLDSLSNDDIDKLSTILKEDPFFSGVDIDMRITQISIKSDSLKVKQHKMRLDELIYKGAYSLRTLASDHSIDVIPNDISKTRIIEFMRELSGESVLSIGDTGHVQGNDFDLLSSKFSLSVDTISLALESCWNLAPLGVSGPSATLYYLENLSLIDGGVKLRDDF